MARLPLNRSFSEPKLALRFAGRLSQAKASLQMKCRPRHMADPVRGASHAVGSAAAGYLALLNLKEAVIFMASVVQRSSIRLTTPLVRKNGRLEPATWDEAFGVAARGFQRIKSRSGETGLGVFSCSKSTNELNYLASKFSRVVFGTNNVDSCNRT